MGTNYTSKHIKTKYGERSAFIEYGTLWLCSGPLHLQGKSLRLHQTTSHMEHHPQPFIQLHETKIRSFTFLHNVDHQRQFCEGPSTQSSAWTEKNDSIGTFWMDGAWESDGKHWHFEHDFSSKHAAAVKILYDSWILLTSQNQTFFSLWVTSWFTTVQAYKMKITSHSSTRMTLHFTYLHVTPFIQT